MLLRICVLTIWMSVAIPVAQAQNNYVGFWNAQLDCPGGAIRFGLEITRGNDGLNGYFVNGQERIKIPRVGVDENGLLVLDIEHYDSKIVAEDNRQGQLVGRWKKRRGADEWVDLNFRTRQKRKSPEQAGVTDGQEFVGRWDVKFEKSSDPAVAVFSKGPTAGSMRGTFLTTTGDYRYLDGSVEGGRMELSCFDGAHAFLFRAETDSNGDLKGGFWSADTWHESWAAKRNESAQLPDAFQQTSVVENSTIGQFQFPDLDGKPTRLDDPRFAGQARIIYVFGSWCPNCHDAAEYFAELQRKYGDRGLSILGLAFEITGDHERDAAQVRKYLERHGATYPVLIAGTSDKAMASRAVPFLDRVRSYPTTVFLDGKGQVRAIHTGFSGPATGTAHQQLRKRFESIIESLLADK